MKLQFRYRFEAAHRFVGAKSPMCQTPHGHTWYATLRLSARQGLDENNMAEEFQTIKGPWKKFIQDEVDHSFLGNIDDPLWGVMKDVVPGFRGLPFPGDPTTEMIAVLFLHKAKKIIEASGLSQKFNAESLLLEETPVNSVELSDSSEIYQQTIKKLKKSGWWNESEISNREISDI